MFFILVLVAAAALVLFGYIMMSNAYQPNTPQGMAKSGKIIAIVFFVTAGLIIIGMVVQIAFNVMSSGTIYGYSPMEPQQTVTSPANTQSSQSVAAAQPAQSETVVVPLFMPHFGGWRDRGPRRGRGSRRFR